jgi:hypothetical protein
MANLLVESFDINNKVALIRTTTSMLDLVRMACGVRPQEATRIRIGFARLAERINVAITRFKHGLVVLADRKFMRQMHPDSGSLLNLARYLAEHKLVRNAPRLVGEGMRAGRGREQTAERLMAWQDRSRWVEMGIWRHQRQG